MQKKTTMTDIARALGVSQTLVSFVLSGKNDMGISPDTKKKVLQTAEKMGYCSNAASKMLKLGRSGCVALVLEAPPKDSVLKLIGEINKGLARYGYSLIVPGNPEVGIDYAECKVMLDSGKVDGFIVVGKGEKLVSVLGEEAKIASVGESDNAEESAGKLCESILGCVKDSDKPSRTRKANPTTARKVTNAGTEKKKQEDAPSEKKEEAPVRRSNDSIWLL